MGRTIDVVRRTGEPSGARRSVSAPVEIAALLVTALIALPIVYLAIRTAGARPESWDLILRSRTLWLATRSVGLAAAVTVATVAIGVPLAWLAVRSDLPGRRVFAVLFALPLVFPSYVGAFTLMASLGPRGMLQQVLEPFGVERLPDIGGFPGAFWALTMFTYPYVYLVTASAIRGLDPGLEDAARSLGRSRWFAFRRVTLPLLRPPIAAGALLVALYTLHDFGAVSLMRYQTFTQAIFLQYKAAFDRTPAAILSLMLVALAVVVVAAEQRSRGRARYFRSGAGPARPMRPARLGRWRWPALAFSAAVVGAALVAPVSVLGYWLVRGLLGGTPLNLTFAAAAGSVAASGLGAAATLLAAIPVAVLAARRPGPAARAVERVAYAGYALPGLVVALAFVFFAAAYTPSLYQTLPLVLLAYVVLFLPQASEPLRGAMLQLSPRVEEAGRVLGRSGREVFTRVTLPLVGRPALAGLALVSLTAMKELPATLLLRPTGFETLATAIWTSASVGRFARAAAPALLLLLLSAVPLAVVARRLEVTGVRAP